MVLGAHATHSKDFLLMKGRMTFLSPIWWVDGPWHIWAMKNPGCLRCICIGVEIIPSCEGIIKMNHDIRILIKQPASITHTIHLQYISLQLVDLYRINVGKYLLYNIRIPIKHLVWLWKVQGYRPSCPFIRAIYRGPVVTPFITIDFGPL